MKIMDYKRIIYEPGKVTRIIFNRPEYLNALSHPAYAELEDAFDRASVDKDCRVIVVSGEGKCFSAGHDTIPKSPENAKIFMVGDGRDIEQLTKDLGSEEAAEEFWWNEHLYYGIDVKVNKWRNIPQPTIAMVHGYCIYGAFFLAATMDLIFASEDALFLPPPLGQFNTGNWDISIRKRKELAFEHRYMPAREAYECGLVSRIYPDRDILEKETLAFADRIADNPAVLQYRQIKKANNLVMDVYGYSAAMKAEQSVGHGPIDQAQKEHDQITATSTSKGDSEANRAKNNLRVKLEAEEKYYPKQ